VGTDIVKTRLVIDPLGTSLLLTLAFLMSVTTPSWSATLKAGVARVDITPAEAVPLWGYSDRKEPATGVLDPLYARVLVLEVGSQRLALVTVDLGRSFGPASLARLRKAASQDVSLVIVAASHTHSGPVIQDQYPNGTPAWEQSALENIANAIAQARAHLVDVQIGTGYGVVSVGHNRLRVNSDGTVSWFERNLTQIPTAPVDGTVSVLRLDTAAGEPLAILVNYACHPVVFGSDNLQYSADFPAAMARTVEGEFAGKPLCFFLQGAPGDINPYYAVTPLDEDALGRREWTGQTLGQEASRIATRIHTQADAHPDLQYAEELVAVPLRWNAEKWHDALIAVFGGTGFQTFPTRSGGEVQLTVDTVLINKRIAILTMPGEPFVEYQVAWRQQCPVPDAFLSGYSNGYEGYFPTIRSATLGGYGAANPATWVEVGAGDRMVEIGVISINRMLGRLHELPEDLHK
jgi:neutral ceramidase